MRAGTMTRSQLERLARPVPAKFVKQLEGRGNPDYVPHSVITEILLAVVGPFDYSVSEIVRNMDGKIVGCLATLSCEIDGRVTTVTEVGDTTGIESDEGSALKNASSDGLKRCAMRLGLGLALWSGKEAYFLYEQLSGATNPSGGPETATQDDSDKAGMYAPCEECGHRWPGHTDECIRRPM